MLTILGNTIREPIKQLETFEKPASITTITMTCDEVTSLCAVPGQPDFATITITYEPTASCIESKSLKLYLWSFRETQIFGEQLASRICDDITRACTPSVCSVTVAQKSRGGIAITSTARKEQ